MDYLIENPKRMTKEEIFQAFQGKWVYMVDVEGEEFGPWYSAVPVVAADRAWPNDDSGIYEKFRDGHKNWMYRSFLQNEINIFGFTEVVDAHA